MTSVAVSPRRALRRPHVWLPVATVVALVGLWELVVRVDLVSQRYSPPPTVIVAELAQMLGEADLWIALGNSLTGWGISLLISVVAGTALGLLLGRVAALSALFSLIIEFLRPIPSIAMIPLAILILGTARPTEVFLATYAGFFQMLVAAIGAAGVVDPVSVQTARSFGLSTWQQVRHVLIPSMLPRLVTGIRIASSTVLIFCITAELVAGVPGLGAQLGAARSVGNTARMYAYVVVIGLVGYLLAEALKAIEKKALFWDPSVRSAQR